MATEQRYKKAKILRDYMIQADVLKMFKEDEKDDTIFFRTAYTMAGDRKQVVLAINDSVYLGLQALLVQNVPAEKNAEVLAYLNECNLELPTVKYVLTKDQAVVASMFFTADEKTILPQMIIGGTMQVLKNVAERHYSKLKDIIGE